MESLPQPRERLRDLRVLIVEDETLVALLMEDILSDLDCKVVGTVARVSQALELLKNMEVDVAILDVNVGGQEVYPVASALSEAGTPFIFATGYGEAGIAEPWSNRPLLHKPFHNEDLVNAVISVLN
ncbi:MAG TPA: response regulator [Sphingomonadales bacterium]